MSDLGAVEDGVGGVEGAGGDRELLQHEGKGREREADEQFRDARDGDGVVVDGKCGGGRGGFEGWGPDR